MNESPKLAFVAAPLLLISLVLLPAAEVGALRQPRSEVAYYIGTYGEVSPAQDPQVARAHRVFERVRAAADKSSKRLPKLVVVNSPGNPWAVALPTGHIVLSKRAVAISHKQAIPAEAEARLAFVLGHELAHLANDDFWHHEVYSFLSTHSNRQVADFLRQHGQVKKSELAADDKGYIYAAIAGYPVASLLKSDSGKADFFNFWMQQTNTRVQLSHPSARDRADLLRGRLNDVQKKLDFFDFGVRLSHFDYCDDGVYFLREFQLAYPGREVLNNLGYCHLQMARQEMDADRAYFYWMPLLLDPETRAGALVRSGKQTLKTLKQAVTSETEGLLKEAVEYLQQAAKADPGYLPARLNLAVAYLYLGRPHQARAVLKEAQDLAPDDPMIQSMEALALYEQSEPGVDLWPAAVARLEQLAAKPNAPPSLLFNLARLLEVRSNDAAHGHWNRLVQTADRLPAPIRSIVCREQSSVPLQSCGRVSSKSARPPPWRWPLSVSGFQRLSPQMRQQLLSGWKAVDFDWFTDKLHGHMYQHPGRKAEVLEVDGFVQMQVLKGGRLGAVRDLSSYCPRPLRQRTLAQGTAWSCDDWAALALGEQVREVWWVAK